MNRKLAGIVTIGVLTLTMSARPSESASAQATKKAAAPSIAGRWTLTTSADGPHATLNAVLKDNGTLAGYLSSERGDMTWTAERVKDGK
jgi:hypothetical protein